MPTVFISYSRKDDEFASRIADSLRAAGYEVWRDISGLRGGQAWTHGIDEGLRASDAVVIIISPDSMVSEWVRKETLFAQGLKKLIVPVMWREVDLPVHLVDLHFVDFRGAYDRAVAQLIEALPPPGPADSPGPASADTAPADMARGGLSQMPRWVWGAAGLIAVLVIVVRTVAPGIFSPSSPDETASQPQSAAEIIVDDAHAGFAIEAGLWEACPSEVCQGTSYGAAFRYAEPGCTDCRARFDFTVATSGDYDVWTWWPRGDDRAVDTPFTVLYSGGSFTINVDQRSYGNAWHQLGTLAFEVGEEASIVVEGSHTGYANADAIALTPVGAGPPGSDGSPAP